MSFRNGRYICNNCHNLSDPPDQHPPLSCRHGSGTALQKLDYSNPLGSRFRMATVLPFTSLTEGQLQHSFNSRCLRIEQMPCRTRSISASYQNHPSYPYVNLTMSTLLRSKKVGMDTLSGRNTPTRQRGQQRYSQSTNLPA